MPRERDRYEAIVARLKRIPGVAYILVAATLVISLASFLDATTNIIGFLRGGPTPASSMPSDSGGLIAEPTTPADHYHNARIYDLNGDTRNAKRSYDLYFQSHQEFVDPYLYFQELLKNTDGLSAARSYFDAMLAKSPDSVLYQFLTARLQDRPERVRRYGELLAKRPKYVPLLHALTQEYSMKALGRQTLDEQRLELDYLEALVAAGDGVFAHYLDKAEAIRLMDDARSRLKLASEFNAKNVEQRVSVQAETYGEDDVSLTVIPNELASEIWYQLPGMSDFKSTGPSAVTLPDGTRYPNVAVEAGKLSPGRHTVAVKYRNLKGVIVGPFDREFVVLLKAVQDADRFIDNQWPHSYSKVLRFRRQQDATSLDFGWASSLGLFTNVTFRLDGEGTTRSWFRDGKRPDSDSLVLTADTLGPGSHDLSVQLEFANGRKAALRYRFVVPRDDEWHDVQPVEVTDP